MYTNKILYIIAIMQFLYKLKNKLLPFITNLRFSKKPFWLMHQPQDYYIKGQTIELIQKDIKPGDIILRGYDNKFLDGILIMNKKGYTQSGIYIGFNRVVHMTTQGIQNSHLYDFCRADKLMVIRLKGNKQQAVKRAKQYLFQQIPFDYLAQQSDKSLYCHQLCAKCYQDISFKKFRLKLFGFSIPLWYGSCYLDQSLIKATNAEVLGVY